TLVRRFGKWGHRLYELAFGYDNNPIETHWLRKSLGVEETFISDLLPNDVGSHVIDLHDEACLRFARYQKKVPQTKIIKQFVKIKTHDFKVHTYERVLESPTLTLPAQEEYQL